MSTDFPIWSGEGLTANPWIFLGHAGASIKPSSPGSVFGGPLSRLPFSSSRWFRSVSTDSWGLGSMEEDMVSGSESPTEGWRCSMNELRIKGMESTQSRRRRRSHTKKAVKRKSCLRRDWKLRKGAPCYKTDSENKSERESSKAGVDAFPSCRSSNAFPSNSVGIKKEWIYQQPKAFKTAQAQLTPLNARHE